VIRVFKALIKPCCAYWPIAAALPEPLPLEVVVASVVGVVEPVLEDATVPVAVTVPVPLAVVPAVLGVVVPLPSAAFARSLSRA